LVNIAGIKGQGKQAEKAAEDVLALRDPGDRFDPQRMHREQRGHQEASPEGAGQLPQPDEDERGVHGVEQNAGEMMAGGLQTEQLTVHHVGQHRQRVPVG